jgi:hypothetical protein
MGFTPELAASGNISPFRFVKISGDFTGAACTAITDQVIGVTDGSLKLFSSTWHAQSGDPISLQPSNTVQVELGGTVTAGNYLMPKATDGTAVVAAGATAVSSYIALQGGDSGDIIRAFRFGQRSPVFT